MKHVWKAFAAVLCLATSSAFAQTSIAEQQDARVIENLRAAGADLSKLHDIDFFLMFDTKSQAESAAAEIERLGYRIAEIESSPDGTQWQIHATRQMVPALDAMTAITRSFEALAQKHGGYYDGWGTSAVQ
ncbi:ribonuclease E inhibitor RraB [Lysobacter sp. 2RAF19]